MDGEPVILPLVAAAREEDAASLFSELRQPLWRYLLRLGLQPEESHEIVQETFLRLHRHLAGNGSRENLRSWIFRVGHNLARNRQKSERYRAAEPLPEDERVDPAAGPEQALLEKERMARLRAAMEALPEIQRECLHLRAEGLRYREIAEVLEIGVTTVADHIERAIRRLAKELP